MPRNLAVGDDTFTVPDNAVEINAMRTTYTKTFDLGPGALPGERVRHFVRGIGPLHYDDGGTLREIKVQIVDAATELQLTTAPYELRVPKDSVRMIYRDGTSVSRAILTEIGDVPIASLSLNIDPQIIDRGRGIVWINLVAGVDIFLHARAHAVSMGHRLKNAAAPRKFRWRIEERTRSGRRSPMRVNDLPFGKDNEDMTATRDEPEGPRRKLELVRQEENITVSGDDRDGDYVVEWTGASFERERVTRNRVKHTDIEYPVTFA